MKNVLLIAVLALPLAAAEPRIFQASKIPFGEAPPSLPKGAQAVVLDGDPNAEGIVTMRLRLPAGYRIAPHRHTTFERVTVLEGSYWIGQGETWDESKLREVTAGGFSVMPHGVAHFTMTKTGAVIQVHVMGPWQVIYVKNSDDPRTPKQ